VTLILAVKGDDGIAVASDGGVTTGGGWPWLLPPAQKVYTCSNRAAWGGAGAQGVIQRIKYAFDKKDESDPLWLDAAADPQQLRQLVSGVVRPVLAEVIGEHLGDGQPPSASTLFAAVLPFDPCVVAVYGNGSSEVIHGQNAAIGSGTFAAIAIMKHFADMHPTVRHAAVVAVQGLSLAIQCMPELTEPISLALVEGVPNQQPTARIVGPEEMQEFRALAEAWQDIQGEVLQEMVQPAPEAEPPGEPPAPPA
jgi:20S proteasome alpha/beta subunit